MSRNRAVPTLIVALLAVSLEDELHSLVEGHLDVCGHVVVARYERSNHSGCDGYVSLAFSRAVGECAATLSVAKKDSSTSTVIFGFCNGITSVRSISLGCFLNLKVGRIGSFSREIKMPTRVVGSLLVG
jgi:ABC-type phosphate transport system permease subunit